MEQNATTLRTVLGDFLCSYARKDKDVAFRDWLIDELREKLPELTAEAGARLATEIVDSVAGFDRTRNEIQEAFEEGDSKEEWLANQLTDSYAGLPPETAGERLLQVEASLDTANAQLMRELDGEAAEVLSPVPVEWNELSLKDRAYGIAKKVGMTSLAVAANAAKYKMESEESVSMREAIGEVLQEGLPVDSAEVKAAVAGAVKVASVTGLSELLPEGSDIHMIGSMAGAAVETAEALLDAANGEITTLDAMDKIGQAGTAVFCHIGVNAIRTGLPLVPVVGPVLSVVAEETLDYLESAQFVQHAKGLFSGVFHALRDAAVVAFNGVKQAAKTMVQQVKADFNRA